MASLFSRQVFSSLALLVTLSIAAGALIATAGSARAEKEEKVLRHIVLYKFKEEVTPAQLQEVIDAFSALPSKIDTIIDFEHGPNNSPEGKSDGLTYAFVVTFRDEAGRAKYLTHPAHDEYVKVVKDRREKVVVFDYMAPAK
ncbi:Stress responsive alpha-beta barrel domain protein [Pirellula staleyi DSM 6068]|uniref:Stress responsive alpha-beta barrel domain protein n=1 Tax=Pirellula staleyi (strain ATCC 27377 / DSM 6068 / ICPB 4128) TaxID=530564 RepID=D2R0M3_PIRSD|nr:Dabb family protein [Pirellula staleyi]ADB16621.1 Stress responsive alpha-beta barrel domain protein [Pirellula staleyi DSM 6068]